MSSNATETCRVVTGEQVRAARKLLGWSAGRIGLLCGLHNAAIYQFERTGEMPSPMFNRTNPVDRVAVIRSAFEAAGVVFTDAEEAGVKLREVEM